MQFHLKSVWRYCLVHLRHAVHNGSIFYVLAAIVLLPVWFNPHMKLNSMVQDTLFVIDISESMNVPDVNYPQPRSDRLTLAKHIVQAGLASLPCGSRVAVALFAADEVVVLFEPLEVCRHYPAIEHMVSGLNRRMRWIGDSLITEVVVNATQEAKKRDLNLVLITDGDEMPRKDTPYINALLKQRGQIKGLLLGVGGETLQPIPRFNERDEMIGYWTQEDAVLQGNYPDLLALVRQLSPGERAPEGMLDHVTEYVSSYRPKVMKQIADAIAYDLKHVDTPDEAVSALRQAKYAKYALANRDARWIFGIIAAFLVLTGWFWPQITLIAAKYIRRKQSVA